MTSKYRAVRTGGYASKRESRRAEELKLLEKIGAISMLQEQVRYQLIAKSQYGREIVYIADFTYFDKHMGVVVTEDVKGMLTPVYRLKKRLMAERYGIEIQEVR